MVQQWKTTSREKFGESIRGLRGYLNQEILTQTTPPDYKSGTPDLNGSSNQERNFG